MQKLCRACGSTKPASDFHKDRSKSDGLNAYCKPCQIARQVAYDKKPPRHEAPEGMKRCQRCKQTKPKEEFYKQARKFEGLSDRCAECTRKDHDKWRRSNLDKAAENGRRWRKNNPERFKDHCLKQALGLPLGTYAEMLKSQDGKCAICKSSKSKGRGRFHVDHCHDKENIRGLLCSNCNLGIGHFLHDPLLLEAAIKYLSTAAPYQLPERAIKRRG